ncbi:hypothetical protein Tco_1166838 [Tanacetum coccineum]
MSQDDDERLCLVDDLKEAQVYIQVKLFGTSLNLKSKITTSCSQDEVKKTSKNKGLIAETYEWDKEEVSYDENEAIDVKALMALANEERVSVSKESPINGEWVKISIQKDVTKHYETCGSNAHTTSDHIDIEWFRKGEAKKAGVNKKTSSNVLRSKTPTQRLLAKIWEVPRPEGMYGDDSTYTTEGHGHVKLWYSFHKRST